MDFYIWALALYLEGEAQNAALEIPEDGIAEESVLTVFYTVHIDYLRILPSWSIKLWKHLKCLNIPVMSIQSFLNEFLKRLFKTKSYSNIISEDVLAYRLLKSANISNQHKQLIKDQLNERPA